MEVIQMFLIYICLFKMWALVLFFLSEVPCSQGSKKLLHEKRAPFSFGLSENMSGAS
jgi:hypothetical protein